MQFEQLGPYRLGRRLGQGGMGAVYAAIDVETQQPAAVKVLAPALTVEEGLRARFEAEIESLKKLKHPNIVRLFGYGEHSGLLFYAMELVDGPSLEDEIKRGRRFSWREVIGLTIQLCRALKHAHDHGVIHRDIKPANLLLAPDGQIKLSDFGIARLFGNARMTRDGGILGTAEYMAPEQADGRPVTDRCDQYSLGGVMFTLLASRPPFAARSLVEMLQMQRFNEPPSLIRLVPDIPEELDQIVHQLLAKDPQQRFANTAVLSRSLEAMEHALSRESPDNVPPGGPADEKLSSRKTSLGAIAATLAPSDDPEPLDLLPDNSLPGKESAVGATVISLGPAVSSTSERATARETADRFTKVDELAHAHSAGHGDGWQALLAPQSLGILTGLLLLVALGWYALQPVSADQLSHKIETQLAGGEPDDLLAAERDIQDFVAHFPDDARTAAMQKHLDDIELVRRDRKIKRNVARLGRESPASPIEQAYAEAIRDSASDPDRAAAKLQAIVELFDDPSAPDATREFVALAQKELKRVESLARQMQTATLGVIESRLARADALRVTDLAKARRMWQGIVELYGDKLWAAPLVARAQESLEASAEKPVDAVSEVTPTESRD